jgi:ABC-type transporter Mla subunit MlaD
MAQESEAAELRRGARRFLWGSVCIALLLMAAILVRQGLFKQMASLNFLTESAQDINKGQSVKIAGFRVGSVDTVTLQPDGQVAVVLSIDQSHMRFVTRDAVVELRKEGFVGGATLEIIPGNDKSRLASNEATLVFSRAEGLTAVANSLRDKILPVLDDIKAITSTLADPKQGLPASLAAVKETTGHVDALLKTGTQQVSALGNSTGKVLGAAQEDLHRLGQIMGEVNGKLPALMDKTQKVIDHIEKISAEAEVTVPPALKDGAATATDVREIVTGAKGAWPLRNLVDSQKAGGLVLDSDPHAEGSRAAP